VFYFNVEPCLKWNTVVFSMVTSGSGSGLKFFKIISTWNHISTTTTTILGPFVWDYPGELVPEETLTHPPSWSSSSFYQLLPSTTIHSIILVQITCLTIFAQPLSMSSGLPLALEPSTSYSIHFFTQSLSSFRSTCPYNHNLFCCSINIVSSIPSLSPNSLLGTLSFTLTLHIHLTILISARWSVTSFSFLTGQVSLPCSILLRTQLLYSLPLLINDISLSVSNGTNCLNLFHPIQILASTAASASPSPFNISPR